MAVKHPLRTVVDPGHPRSGRCIGNNRITMQWWELRLECGHTVERPLRFPKQTGRPRRGWQIMHRPRPTSEALPAPKRVRCDSCPALPVQENP